MRISVSGSKLETFEKIEVRQMSKGINTFLNELFNDVYIHQPITSNFEVFKTLLNTHRYEILNTLGTYDINVTGMGQIKKIRIIEKGIYTELNLSHIKQRTKKVLESLSK